MEWSNVNRMNPDLGHVLQPDVLATSAFSVRAEDGGSTASMHMLETMGTIRGSYSEASPAARERGPSVALLGGRHASQDSCKLQTGVPARGTIVKQSPNLARLLFLEEHGRHRLEGEEVAERSRVRLRCQQDVEVIQRISHSLAIARVVNEELSCRELIRQKYWHGVKDIREAQLQGLERLLECALQEECLSTPEEGNTEVRSFTTADVLASCELNRNGSETGEAGSDRNLTPVSKSSASSPPGEPNEGKRKKNSKAEEKSSERARERIASIRSQRKASERGGVGRSIVYEDDGSIGGDFDGDAANGNDVEDEIMEIEAEFMKRRRELLWRTKIPLKANVALPFLTLESSERRQVEEQEAWFRDLLEKWRDTQIMQLPHYFPLAGPTVALRSAQEGMQRGVVLLPLTLEKRIEWYVNESNSARGDGDEVGKSGNSEPRAVGGGTAFRSSESPFHTPSAANAVEFPSLPCPNNISTMSRPADEPTVGEPLIAASLLAAATELAPRGFLVSLSKDSKRHLPLYKRQALQHRSDVIPVLPGIPASHPTALTAASDGLHNAADLSTECSTSGVAGKSLIPRLAWSMLPQNVMEVAPTLVRRSARRNAPLSTCKGKLDPTFVKSYTTTAGNASVPAHAALLPPPFLFPFPTPPGKRDKEPRVSMGPIGDPGSHLAEHPSGTLPSPRSSLRSVGNSLLSMSMSPVEVKKSATTAGSGSRPLWGTQQRDAWESQVRTQQLYASVRLLPADCPFRRQCDETREAECEYFRMLDNLRDEGVHADYFSRV